MRKQGFTLIELLVVISIIGVLSSIVLISINSARDKASNAYENNNIEQLVTAINLYLTENNSYPTSGGTWQCVGVTTGTCWGGYFPAVDLNTKLIGYISARPLPKDPAIIASGVYYLYNASYSGAGGTDGPGVYLAWPIKDLGQSSCGRGFTFGTILINGINYRECMINVSK